MVLLDLTFACNDRIASRKELFQFDDTSLERASGKTYVSIIYYYFKVSEFPCMYGTGSGDLCSLMLEGREYILDMNYGLLSVVWVAF